MSKTKKFSNGIIVLLCILTFIIGFAGGFVGYAYFTLHYCWKMELEISSRLCGSGNIRLYSQFLFMGALTNRIQLCAFKMGNAPCGRCRNRLWCSVFFQNAHALAGI